MAPVNRILATFLGAALLTGGCAPIDTGEDTTDDTSQEEIQPAKGIWATEDWKDRGDWYKTTQGSHLLDYGVFMALEMPGKNSTHPKFAARTNLEALGFVYSPSAAGRTLTADARLPLGVVKDTHKALGDTEPKEYLGFTCAACHTGELVFGTGANKKRLLIDGGQSFLNFEGFAQGLQKALEETTGDADKQKRFCTALKDQATCNDRLEAALTRVSEINGRNVVTDDGDDNYLTSIDGPGRLDAITRILNDVFAGQLGGDTAHEVTVPVSIPHVWDAPRLSCVQTNCLAKNSAQRNVGETLGVFGHIKLRRGADGKIDPRLGVDASAELANLYKLEHSLVSLNSPHWNDDFGKLDDAKRVRGQAIFKNECGTCHKEPYASTASGEDFVFEGGGGLTDDKGAPKDLQLWRVTTHLYTDVGTDPRFTEVHGNRFVSSPELTTWFDMNLAGAIGPEKAAETIAGLRQLGLRKDDGSISGLVMLGMATAVVEGTKLKELAAAGTPMDKHELEFFRAAGETTEFTNYRARPLNGIAFTAPFGHNGAWPTLVDVLSPEKDRPTNFVVRPRSFDPAKVGIDTSKPKASEWHFDATKPGNSNKGHLHGVDLPADQKADLLEYLKSI